MTNTKLLHNSFNAGEISPELFSRPDTQQFRFGAARAYNWITKTSGAAQLRPGFESLATLDSRARAISFKEDGDDFIITIEPGSFRLFRNGNPISVQGGPDDVYEVGDQATSGNIDLVNDVLYTKRKHNFADLEEVRVVSVGGTGEPGGTSSTFTYEARPQGPYGLQLKIGATDPVDITSLNTGTLYVWREAGLPADYEVPIPLSGMTTPNSGGLGGTGATYSTITLTSPHGWPVGTVWKWVGAGTAPDVRTSPADYAGAYDGRTFFTVEPTGTLTTSQFEASQAYQEYTFSVGVTNTTSAFTPPVSAAREYLAGQVLFLRANIGAFTAGDFIRAKNNNFSDSTGPQTADWEVVPSPWLTIPNSYTAAQLNELTYAQTAGRIRFAHRSHPTLELFRTEAGVWSYRNPLAASDILLAPVATATRGAQIGVASSTAGTFGQIVARAVTGLGAGDLVYALGTTGVAPGYYVVGLATGGGGLNIDELMDLTGALATSVATSGGGTLIPVESTADSNTRYIITAVDVRGREFLRSTPSASLFNLLNNAEAYNSVSWTTTGEAAAYRIYKEVDGTELFGFIAEAGAPPFLDRNVEPDYAVLAPNIDTELQLDYPGAVAFYDQRGAFGGNTAKPQGLWLSSLGRDDELITRRTQLDTDRIALEIASREGQSVRHIVPVSELLVLSNTAAWSLTTQNTDSLTPASATIRSQTTQGSSFVRPQVIDNSVLYASEANYIFRLGFKLAENSFGGVNLSTRAAHLFDDIDLVDSASTRSRIPGSWYSDTQGRILGLTYSEEEQVAGWHRHAFHNYYVRSVASAQEGSEDRLYAVLEHRTTGAFSLARMQSTNIRGSMGTAHLDACFNRSTQDDDASTISIQGPARLGADVRVTSTGISFDFNMLGEVIFLPDQGFHARIKTRTSRTEVVAEVIAVGTSPTPPATPAWGVTVSRLRNLELQSVSAATVTALLQPLSGLVEVHTLAVPANGQLTLPFPCRAVHLGDAYVNELRTMPVTAQVEAAGMGRMKAISHAYVRLFQTAGLRVGPDLERMSDISPGNNELRSEETRELIEQSWTRDGQISFAQHLPLPATVAGVTIDVTFGD